MPHPPLAGVPPAILTSLAVAAFCAIPATAADRNAQRIQVSHDNPRYWQYKGKTVLLLGGSDEDNLFNDPDLMLQNLNALRRVGGNYIRGTLSCRDEGNVWPYEQLNGKYDLRRFNAEFWDRLDRCCRECYRRDVIVQIEVWATFDYYRENWLRNPWNPANNINYTTDDTKLVEEWNFHPAQRPQPFFSSPPELNDDAVLREHQDAFVRKVLDVTAAYPNVLYCLDNETRANADWAWYWGQFIKQEAQERGTPVEVTEMWDMWDLTHADHSVTYTRPDLFSFCDVSQNNWQIGQTHYDRLLWYRTNLEQQPGGIRPMNNVKVYGMLRPGQGEAMDHNLDRWWQNIWAGCASTRFHRPATGIGLNEVAQQAIRAARVFTNAFDLFGCEPRPDLLSDREENEAYLLAAPPSVYALYFPQGGQVTVALDDETNGLRLWWLDPKTAKFSKAEPVPNGPQFSLQTPTTDQTWLALVAARRRG